MVLLEELRVCALTSGGATTSLHPESISEYIFRLVDNGSKQCSSTPCKFFQGGLTFPSIAGK
jgi:hypothetical protein